MVDVLEEEHREIKRVLTQLIGKRGGVGDAAKKLSAELDPHLEKEESLIMPVLDSLGDMAVGSVGNSERAAELAGKVEAEYYSLFREHELISDALDALLGEANKAGDREAIDFVDHLRRHVKIEEAVLYPAALIAAKYAEKMISGQVESYRGLEVGEPRSFKGGPQTH
jgi:hemerythrin-like domain-containing protein